MSQHNMTMVDTDALKEAVRLTKSEIEKMAEIENALVTAVAAQLHLAWEGPAKDAFFQELSEFVKQYNTFLEDFANYNSKLDSAAAYYSYYNDQAKQYVATLGQ